jgi:hypothetical protein
MGFAKDHPVAAQQLQDMRQRMTAASSPVCGSMLQPHGAPLQGVDMFHLQARPPTSVQLQAYAQAMQLPAQLAAMRQQQPQGAFLPHFASASPQRQ